MSCISAQSQVSGPKDDVTRSVVYVANTDIPSRMANSIQVMKNADAWASISRDFSLLTCTSLSKHLRLNPAAVREFYGLRNRFEIRTYPLHGLFSSRWRPLRELYYRFAVRWIEARQPSFVFTRSYLLPPLLPASAPPTVVETHGPPDGNPDKQRLFRAVQEGKVAALLTISEALKLQYLEAGLPEERVVVLPDGFDAQQFANPLARHAAASRLDLPSDRLIAGYIGHLYDHRGVEDILQAATRLPDVLFLFVGGHDADIARRRREAEALGLRNVRFEGFVPNARVPEYLWACDILLMPYSRACPTADWMSPLKLFEYMGAGRAIVCSDLPALRTVVSHGETALLAKSDSSDALYAQIRLLANDAGLRERLGGAAREAAGQYSWEQRVQRLARFLQERGLVNSIAEPSRAFATA